MTKRDILLLTLRRLPVHRQQRGEVVLIGHERQACEDVVEIGEGFFAVALAGYDNRVDDGGALPASG